MSDITVTGMVLSSMSVGEYDKRLELLTAEAGRISAFARGAKRPSSDLVSAGRAFAFGKFTLFQGKSSYTVKSAKISEYFTDLAQDVVLTYYGFYFLEVARYFSRENVAAPEQLKLNYFALKALLKESLDNRLVRAVFELKSLCLNGLLPSEEWLGTHYKQKTGHEPDQSSVYTLWFIRTTPVEKLFTFKLTEKVLEEVMFIAEEQMGSNCDKPFKSLQLLENLLES
ncbi:MAG: DNA repair protein RecO [Parasporobacterium sp.]|nr:DNA repair protein RecO [Parasporobacterium sp.]